MLTLHIDDNDIENIFVEGFHGNQEKFLAFIQSSYEKKESLVAFNDDRERFLTTYAAMKNASMQMLSDEVATQEIDAFLNTL